MKMVLAGIILGAAALSTVGTAYAGCISGAVVGGVAGHIAGHGKVGAAAGCAIGHEKAKKNNQSATNQAPQQQTK